MEQKEEMKAKMGNWSCAMKELKIVDDNLELDLENMLDDIKSMNIRDKWLEDKTIEDVRTCYAVSLFFANPISNLRFRGLHMYHGVGRGVPNSQGNFRQTKLFKVYVAHAPMWSYIHKPHGQLRGRWG